MSRLQRLFLQNIVDMLIARFGREQAIADLTQLLEAADNEDSMLLADVLNVMRATVVPIHH